MDRCSALCLRTPSCIKWSRNNTLCQLHPLHSASNPLTESNNSLYQSKLPEGFSLSADRTVAYRARLFSLLGGREAVISACREYDPEAVPAVPRTKTQYEAMKALTPAGKWLYVGVWEPRVEGEFVDMLTGERVDVPPQWFLYGVVHKSTTSNCMVMLPGGLYTSECNVARHGHICEYRP
ncbi:hypothetical protein FJT64_013063 [Amphibalanus amphitrite]|uniref:C-type lectin domain-containing protein n=1 Tax=Amphibalanus amphitrite TaxID=1232801 RepID=A0A6A4VDV3_AMPAM|nr:hypothetical protein FJT64_013063 [Amphibalanus amphitrite]